jgi:glycosyltransferase involved in cell wall biosynthesis
MRVCILAHAHPSLSRGGGETAAWRQHLALRAAGHDSALIAAAEAPADRLPTLPDDQSLYSALPMEPDRLAWAEAAPRDALLARLLATRAEVFHLHHLWRVGLDLAAMLRDAAPRARLVLTLHELLAVCANHGQMVTTKGAALCGAATDAACAVCFPGLPPRHFALRRAAFARALSLFDAVVAPSRFLLGRVRDAGLPLADAHVIENTLGDSLLDAPRPPLPPGLSARFAFFGQPTPFKGLDVLLAAFMRAAIPGARLDVHGCTADEVLGMFPALAPAVAAAGDALAFHGRYPPDEVLARMRRSGWVVVPSVWWENSPMVIAEAKRAGVPLIVSGIGGMAEKVRDGLDGLHVPPRSAEALAATLATAADPALHARIAATLADATGRAEAQAAIEAVLAPRPRGAAAVG